MSMMPTREQEIRAEERQRFHDLLKDLVPIPSGLRERIKAHLALLTNEGKPVLTFGCDVCGAEIDFPAICDEPAHLVVQKGAESTCDRCGAVGRITIDGTSAFCVVDNDDPAWDREARLERGEETA